MTQVAVRPALGFGGHRAGCISLVAGATIATRWFEKNRGTVMGLFSASSATGQLVFLPFFAILVTGPGWRFEVLFIGAVCAVLAPLALLVLRDYPADMNLPMLGATEIAPPRPTTVNPFSGALGGLRDGVRSRDFWLLTASFFICGASTNGLIGTHLVPACGDYGIPEVKAAGLLAAMGIFDLIGTTASGWLSDRFSSRWLLFGYYGARGVSLMFLPAALGSTSVGLAAFAVFYGLDWLATVPPTLKLATNAFGRARAPMMLAGRRRPSGRRRHGSHRRSGPHANQQHNAAFIGSGMLCLIAAVIVLFIGRTLTLAEACIRAMNASSVRPGSSTNGSTTDPECGRGGSCENPAQFAPRRRASRPRP